MAHKSFKVSVPGSMMLMGEHAVLAGKSALVCAVSKRLSIELIPSDSQNIIITDTKLGTKKIAVSQLALKKPFEFVLAAILQFKSKIKTGFSLNIKSEFSSTLGLGSSAAVTVATVAVIGKWLNLNLTEQQIFKTARKAMLLVQGLGSGADLAASVYGGVLAYNARPLKVSKLPLLKSITAIYSGYKTPTKIVVNQVKQARKLQPKLYASIFTAMHICVQRAILAIKQKNWPALGKLFLQHQGLQSSLGVSNELLDQLVNQLAAQPNIYGAKISGSGLGDCIIGLGELKQQVFPNDAKQQQQGVLQIPLTIDAQGLIYVN